jgi:hypothetical protein
MKELSLYEKEKKSFFPFHLFSAHAQGENV